ncbi:hypothetical protein CBX96_07465 [Shewanella sp. BC20]|nr:hypothetical protein CBX96_07465 [Shewanella sp. BC20]
MTNQRLSTLLKICIGLGLCLIMLGIYLHNVGRVDVSGLFLQQFGWLLCKAKSVLCSYST